MLIYKNNSYSTKTFYGVVFKPGDIKEVPGYINCTKFIRLTSVPKELPERTEQKKRKGRPKKETPQKSKNVSKQAEVNLTPKENENSQEVKMKEEVTNGTDYN